MTGFVIVHPGVLVFEFSLELLGAIKVTGLAFFSIGATETIGKGNEFGPIGEWEVPKDQNGLEIEPNDDQKEYWYKDVFLEHIQKHKGSNFGGFAFIMGDKAGFGDMWLNLLLDWKHRPSFLRY